MDGRKIRVVIVDDAQFMRKTLAQILSTDPSIEVVGYGKTGREALEAIERLRPDVVTLDIDMPEMDGIRALRHIMIRYPTPVVVVSALRRDLKSRVFDTIIPRNVRLAEVPKRGNPALLFDISSVGARSYLALAKEIIEKT